MKGFFPSSLVQTTNPKAALVPKCGICGLFKTCKSPKMKPYGQGSKVLVVGEAPGQTEDERGRPFVGKAGRFLRETLDRFGIDLDEDAVTTNSLICRPPKNAAPDLKQIGYCYPNILNTIRKVQPRVIVTLGRWALASVIQGYWKGDIGTMERWVGWRIPVQDYWICPTYHPSFLLRSRNPLMDRLFAQHLKAAFEIKEPPPAQEDYTNKIEVWYDERQIYSDLRKIDEQGGWIAIDYETNCLKPEYPKARIISCAVSNGDITIAYPWFGKAITATGMLLKSKRTRKISSNLKMEEKWTRKEFGHGVSNWGWDTMIAAHCLDNRPDICSLKFQALIKLGVPSYNENIEPYLINYKGHYNREEEIELKTLLFYNGMDALLEYKVAMKQRKEMGYE